MTEEKFNNIVEDIIMGDALFYNEDIPNLRLLEAYDYVQTVCDDKGEWVYHIVADEEDEEVTIIDDKTDPIFYGRWNLQKNKE